MKGESTLFPGAPLSPALCDNPVFMPEGLDGHHDASAHVPRRHSQITTWSLCRFQLPHPFQTQDTCCFFLHYFIRHMSTLAGIIKIAWRVGSRRKKEEAIVGKKEEKTGYFFFVQTLTFTSKTQANVNA